MGVWARRSLGSYWSGEITIKVEHRLIRSGPSAGYGIRSMQPQAILGLVMAIFAYCRKIRLELANLVTAFGLAYDAYRRGRGALIPQL